MAISRYRNTEVLKLNLTGSRYYNDIKLPSKKKLEKVPTFKVRISQFDRLDQLAAKHLGDGTYWWVIALLNDIDWIYDFEVGSLIKIPINVEDVLRLL